MTKYYCVVYINEKHSHHGHVCVGANPTHNPCYGELCVFLNYTDARNELATWPTPDCHGGVYEVYSFVIDDSELGEDNDY